MPLPFFKTHSVRRNLHSRVNTHRLNFDFLNSQVPLRRPYRMLGWGLLTLGGIAMLASLSRYEAELARAEALAAQVEHLRTQRPAPIAPPPIPPTLQTAFRQADHFAGQLAIPWNRLWNAIEACRSDDIALLTIELDPERSEIGLAGEARNMHAVDGFSQTLAESGAFSRVSLARHKLSDGPTAAVVRFELRLAWRAPHMEGGA